GARRPRAMAERRKRLRRSTPSPSGRGRRRPIRVRAPDPDGPSPPLRPRVSSRRRQEILEAARELDTLSAALAGRRLHLRTAPAPASPPTQRLRILMVGWEFPPHHSGGLGVHCYELCKELTRMGHSVVFLTPFRGPFLPVPGVEFR